MDTFGTKLKQKALKQPKQKKSKSAEFLMGEEERDAVVGIENPAFNGGGSAEPSVPLVWVGREIRGDRPDSTLAAHPKKMELQAPAKERGDEHAQNYFDPSSAAQADTRHCRMAGASAEDELELTLLNADENRLYHTMAALLDEDDTFIDIPGTLQASGDEEVLEVKSGDPVLQRRLMLHSGGRASGPGPSQPHATARTQFETGAGLEVEAGPEAGRMVMGSESTVKMRIAEEVIPHYTQQLRARVQPDMITLGSLSLQQMNQSTTPQPVEVCVCCLRAARDKLPRGLYAVSLSLYSRLGGSALAWRGEKEEQQWAVTTEPVEHRGRFHDTSLHINQSLFTILPAAREVVPSMALIFQLIALPGASSHVSSVLAWGAFPVCGPGLGLVQGRFKTPLLRGEPNTQLDQFRKIEGLLSSDLDHWLCNMYFQVKRLPSGGPERGTTALPPPANPPVVPRPDGQRDPLQSQLPLQPQPSSQPQLCTQSIHPQSLSYPQQQPHAGPSGGAGEPAAVYSHRGSPLHLSADSACSSSSLPGRDPPPISGNPGEKGDPCGRVRAEGGIHYKKKPIKKTNSCGPSVSSGSAPPRQAGKQRMRHSVENLSTEEMEEYTFSLQSPVTGPAARPPRLSDRARLALHMLSSDLGLPLPGQQQPGRTSWRGSVRQLGLIMLLMALMWFVRLYLHYCSQWLYLQAIAVPVNKFQFHAHTVELVYQSSLLHIWEEMAMLVVGPLTLNALTFLLVLIRWGCQQIFGSLPSFTSKFIMAQGVWTVLDPLAVFAVDAVLGRLTYSPDTPVGDAAKLYWHFYRADQSGAAGLVITLFLYAVVFLLSITILSIYLLRFHNDGHMLDIFQRLTAKEGTYFLPQDLELSNQELSYIVKKAEQWRGFNGERRKVAVNDYVWTAEDPLPESAASSNDALRDGAPPPEGETSTHVVVHTLYLSGQKQRYRHFLRQSNGAIVEGPIVSSR
ncbi:uncharacterized protein ofcc1 [Platichthys flesus]|uniref:uncharacterized protein ofcc1 n=1 Tax=Platichthys flesus TaxID=8260 RepID=UPI002DBCC15A|nr:uncharacterized protein ofcc1 [Platichthys flesus]